MYTSYKIFCSDEVPAYVVCLDAFPLTPNGKVDRQALPTLEMSAGVQRSAPEVPQTLIEELVAGIWQQVLKQPSIGIHENFFELGGHSLLATQVISRICKTFDIKLPLRTLFERPSIASLALVIENVLIEEVEKLANEEA